jgi:hypothetical protein
MNGVNVTRSVQGVDGWIFFGSFLGWEADYESVCRAHLGQLSACDIQPYNLWPRQSCVTICFPIFGNSMPLSLSC